REAVIGVGVESRTGELVATGTQYHVDRTALEVAFGDVVGSDLYGHLLDRGERYRTTRGGQTTLLPTEVVGVASAVHCEAVGTVVLASARDSARTGVERSEGIAACDVADVAVHRSHAFDGVATEHRSRAG